MKVLYLNTKSRLLVTDNFYKNYMHAGRNFMKSHFQFREKRYSLLKASQKSSDNEVKELANKVALLRQEIAPLKRRLKEAGDNNNPNRAQYQEIKKQYTSVGKQLMRARVSLDIASENSNDNEIKEKANEVASLQSSLGKARAHYQKYLSIVTALEKEAKEQPLLQEVKLKYGNDFNAEEGKFTKDFKRRYNFALGATATSLLISAASVAVIVMTAGLAIIPLGLAAVAVVGSLWVGNSLLKRKEKYRDLESRISEEKREKENKSELTRSQDNNETEENASKVLSTQDSQTELHGLAIETDESYNGPVDLDEGYENWLKEQQRKDEEYTGPVDLDKLDEIMAKEKKGKVKKVRFAEDFEGKGGSHKKEIHEEDKVQSAHVPDEDSEHSVSESLKDKRTTDKSSDGERADFLSLDPEIQFYDSDDKSTGLLYDLEHVQHTSIDGTINESTPDTSVFHLPSNLLEEEDPKLLRGDIEASQLPLDISAQNLDVPAYNSGLPPTFATPNIWEETKKDASSVALSEESESEGEELRIKNLSDLAGEFLVQEMPNSERPKEEHIQMLNPDSFLPEGSNGIIKVPGFDDTKRGLKSRLKDDNEELSVTSLSEERNLTMENLDDVFRALSSETNPSNLVKGDSLNYTFSEDEDAFISNALDDSNKETKNQDNRQFLEKASVLSSKAGFVVEEFGKSKAEYIKKERVKRLRRENKTGKSPRV